MEFGKVENVQGIHFALPPIPPSTLEVLRQSSSEVESQVYLGAPQWSDRSLVGVIYPRSAPGEFFYHYSKHFQTIEFNSTYYALPSLKNIESWKQQAEPGFRFCPKIPSSISHERRLEDSLILTQDFCQRMYLLNEFLGVAFLQLPPDFTLQQLPILDLYLKDLPPDLHLAVEFRHASWFQNSQAFHLLNQRNVSTVITDVAGRRDVLHSYISTDKVLVRFVGNNLDASDFKRLDEWAQRIEDLIAAGLKEVYFFLHQPEMVDVVEITRYFANQLAERGILTRSPKLLPRIVQETFF